MSPEDQAAVRRPGARGHRRVPRRRLRAPAAARAPTLVHEMMSFLVAEDVPDEYVPMMLEELELDGADARDLDWRDARRPRGHGRRSTSWSSAPACRACSPASGCGQAGIPFTIVEKNAGVGGTWFENRYPGCRVDVGNHFYCYSFAPDDEWTEFFAQQPELQAYFERVHATSYGVADHIRFETEVDRRRVGRGDGHAGRSRPHGRRRRARTLRGRRGDQRGRPAQPPEAARHRRPRLVRRASPCTRPQWVDGTDLAGKRVAVIGTGASAFQIVPTIAARGRARSPCSSARRRGCSRTRTTTSRSGPACRWAIRHLPYYGRWYRFLLFWPACDGGLPAMRVDPDYPDQEPGDQRDQRRRPRDLHRSGWSTRSATTPSCSPRSCPTTSASASARCRTTAAGSARSPAPNVDLVTDPIDRDRRPTGIVTRRRRRAPRGRRHRLRHRLPRQPVPVADGHRRPRRRGARRAVGRRARRRYLGITVPNFPNLFCLYGPGTNLAHGGSLIFHSECQIRYVMGCLDALLDGDRPRDRGRAGRARRLQRAPPGRARTDGVVATRRSATAGTATTRADLHPVARGASSTTGPGPASPSCRTSSSPEPIQSVASV